jgi:hypothetical protein
LPRPVLIGVKLILPMAFVADAFVRWKKLPHGRAPMKLKDNAFACACLSAKLTMLPIKIGVTKILVQALF